jgi:hypothetical protein
MSARTPCFGVILAICSLFFPVRRAMAEVSIGINFVGGCRLVSGFEDGGPVEAMQPTEVAGVVSQAWWNNAGIGMAPNRHINNTGTLAAGTVRDSTGTVMPRLVVTWDTYGTFSTNIPDTPGNNRMMKGYLDSSNQRAALINISDLPGPFAAAGYDVIVYFDGEQTIGSTDRVGRWRVFEGEETTGAMLAEAFGKDPHVIDFGGTFIKSTGASPNTATYGNYVRMSGLHATTVTLEAFAPSWGDVPRAPVNGIQLVSSVPEPSSFVLCGMALTGIGLYGVWQRRRRGPRTRR